MVRVRIAGLTALGAIALCLACDPGPRQRPVAANPHGIPTSQHQEPLGNASEQSSLAGKEAPPSTR